jgi:hypothetical protein
LESSSVREVVLGGQDRCGVLDLAQLTGRRERAGARDGGGQR